jgi:hypothetical protein
MKILPLLLLCLLYSPPAEAQWVAFWLSPCQKDAWKAYRRCKRDVRKSYGERRKQTVDPEDLAWIADQEEQKMDACRGDRRDDIERCKLDQAQALETKRAQQGASDRVNQ